MKVIIEKGQIIGGTQARREMTREDFCREAGVELVANQEDLAGMPENGKHNMTELTFADMTKEHLKGRLEGMRAIVAMLQEEKNVDGAIVEKIQKEMDTIDSILNGVQGQDKNLYKYNRSEVSECELITMKCIWDAEEPVMCSEIMEELKNIYGLEYKDTTVYTFLKNLKNKGFVEQYRKGVNCYKPLRDAVEYRDGQLVKAVDFWCHGSVSDFVSELLQIQDLSAEDKAEIKKILTDAIS